MGEAGCYYLCLVYHHKLLPVRKVIRAHEKAEGIDPPAGNAALVHNEEREQHKKIGPDRYEVHGSLRFWCGPGDRVTQFVVRLGKTLSHHV